MMIQTSMMGWDIGGAHVKAAVINTYGEVIAVYQQPCHLWKGLDQLQAAVTHILSEAPDWSYQHAITMTGSWLIFSKIEKRVLSKLLLP